MNCTDFEIRDYFLGELPDSERQRTARHLHSCSGCAGELEQLRHLRFALESIPDQEPPQRIGFVSDKVFEPSRRRRAWNAFWTSGPRLGFASAAMLSAALVTLAFKPAPARFVERPVIATAASAIPDVSSQIDRAVRKAVADTEVRQQKRTDLLLSAMERKHELQQRALLQNVADYMIMPQKRVMLARAATLSYGGDSRIDTRRSDTQ